MTYIVLTCCEVEADSPEQAAQAAIGLEPAGPTMFVQVADSVTRAAAEAALAGATEIVP